MIRIKPKKKSYPAYDATKAKGYAERVKALLLERGTINEDISAVCDEAKEHGCEPALIRFAAREMMIDEAVRKERDEKRARYLHAVGLAVEAVQSGEMSARQAAKIYSIGKSSIYKEMHVRAVSADREMVAADFELQPLHDADGVIIENQEVDLSGDDAGHRSEPSEPAGQPVNASPPPAPEGPSIVGQGPRSGSHSGIHEDAERSCGGVESRHAAEAGKARDQRAATGAPGSVGGAVSLGRVSAAGQMQSGVTVPAAGVAPGPHDAFYRELDRVYGPDDEAPATPSVDAVGSSSGRVAPNNPVVTPHVTPDVDLDALMPPHLRRPKPSRMEVGA